MEDVPAKTERPDTIPSDAAVVATKEIPSKGATALDEIHSVMDKSSQRVHITNIFKYWDAKQLQKQADEWIKAIAEANPENVVRVMGIRKPPHVNWTVLTLEDAKMVPILVDFINSNDITSKRGEKMFAKPADEGPARDGAKRKSDDEKTEEKKRQRIERVKEARRHVTDDQIRDAVTPLWREPYEKQLSTKTRDIIKQCALKIVKECKKKFRTLSREKSRKDVELYAWLEYPQPIAVKQTIAAPQPLRNKSEFSIFYQYNEDGSKTPAVGIMANGWAGGVSRPHCLNNTPSEQLAIVDLFNDFLKESSLPVYDSLSHRGFWRTLVVRSSRRTKECMLIVVHAPASGGSGAKDGATDDFSAHFEPERQRLLSVLNAAKLPVVGAEGESISVTSVFFQEFEGLSSPKPEHPVQLVYGKKFIHERLRQCTFQISPGAFFQVNTEGAELLYSLVLDKVREVQKTDSETLLFDVCCGTGTIGLTCMKEGAADHVVGVDISGPAIEDAKSNAKLNGFDCCDEFKVKFVADKAESVLGREIHHLRYSSCNFVAVVDPARDGLHADVIKALRACDKIQRIVYVSCNPTGSLVRDAVLLCSPPTKKYKGGAFQVTSAQPVDMFPGTTHCEMVMVFDRLSLEGEAIPLVSVKANSAHGAPSHIEA